MVLQTFPLSQEKPEGPEVRARVRHRTVQVQGKRPAGQGGVPVTAQQRTVHGCRIGV